MFVLIILLAFTSTQSVCSENKKKTTKTKTAAIFGELQTMGSAQVEFCMVWCLNGHYLNSEKQSVRFNCVQA